MADKIMEESRLKFAFPEKCTVVKFDDTTFYRDYFNKLPEAKGVDFISVGALTHSVKGLDMSFKACD